MKAFVTRAAIMVLALWPLLTIAQSVAPLVVNWPSNDKPVLKLTFDKISQSAVVDGRGIYTANVIAMNVSDSALPRSLFTVYISDKNNVRIGLAKLQLPQISPYQSQKGQINFSAAGIPAGITLLAGKSIPLRVISTPLGANFKVDGEDSGVTPKVFDFTIGSHTLEFSKEGYATGSTTLDVTSDELPGGSVTFELGGLSQDTVELRDGTVLLGDVLAMSITDLTMSVDGKVQKLERNQVKRIMLVEREAPAPAKQSPSK